MPVQLTRKGGEGSGDPGSAGVSACTARAGAHILGSESTPPVSTHEISKSSDGRPGRRLRGETERRARGLHPYFWLKGREARVNVRT